MADATAPTAEVDRKAAGISVTVMMKASAHTSGIVVTSTKVRIASLHTFLHSSPPLCQRTKPPLLISPESGEGHYALWSLFISFAVCDVSPRPLRMTPTDRLLTAATRSSRKGTDMQTSVNDATLSRRSFFKATALNGSALIGVTVMAGCSPQAATGTTSTKDNLERRRDGPAFLTAPEPIADQDISATMDCDVLVLGAGIAGASTAASAVENGLSVIMVDKAETPRAVGLDFGLINPQCALDAGVPEQDPYELTRDHVEKSMHACRVDKTYRFMTRSGEAGNRLVGKVDAWGLEPQIMAYASKSDHYANNPGMVEFWHKGVNLGERGGLLPTYGRNPRRSRRRSGTSRRSSASRDRGGAADPQRGRPRDGRHLQKHRWIHENQRRERCCDGYGRLFGQRGNGELL